MEKAIEISFSNVLQTLYVYQFLEILRFSFMDNVNFMGTG